MGGTTWPLAVMALGGGIAASALQPKINMPSVSEATAGRLNKSLEPECFRKIAFGNTALGTDTRYWEAYGADQSSYDEVIALAGHEITSFDALYVEDELVSFDGSGNATGTYAGALSIKTKLVGTSGSTLSGVGAGSKWATAAGESASMTGIAYMVLKWVWSQEKLPRGFPTRITPVGKGALVYDPRLDSTRGGTGTHRADDQSTWAFTTTDSNGEPIGRNPALQILHYLLGWYVQNPDTSEWVLVHGMGIDPDDIDFASFITAANECEAEEYYADCLLSTGDNHATNLGVLEQACAGKVSDAGGLYTLRIQVDDFTGTLTEFTDDDIVGECDWRPEMPLAQSGYNQIAGQFIDPDALYQLRPLPLIRDAAYETADGEKVRTNARLDAVQDGDQGQKLLRIRLNKSRQKGMFEAPFGWRAINVSVGQPVKLTLTRFGFDERYFRVRAKKVDPGGAVWLALETDHPDVYAGGTVSTTPAVATGAGYDPTSVATPTSDEWGGTGGSVTVTDGAEVPAVTIEAGSTAQPTGITGILAYTSQASNTGPWNFRGEYPPGTDSFNVEGLLANENYYIRLAYRNAFGVIDPSGSGLVLGPFTTGDAVTTDTINVGGTPAEDVLSDIDDLFDDVAAEIADREAALAAERLLTQREIANVSQAVAAEIAGALASVRSEADRRVSEDARVENLVIGVGTRLDGDEFYSAADIDATFLAIADTDAAIAAYDLSGNATFVSLNDEVDQNASDIGDVETDLATNYITEADIALTYLASADFDTALAAADLTLNASFSTAQDDIATLEEDLTTAEAAIVQNAAAIASADRATARALQALQAELANALSQVDQETIATVSRVDSVASQTLKLRAELVGDYSTSAEVAATYLASADLESAVALIDLTANSVFSDALDDIAAIEADYLSTASASATYQTQAGLEDAVAAIDLSANAVFSTALDDIAGLETDLTTAEGNITDAQADIDINATAIAAADRATARLAQSVQAELANALAQADSEILATVSRTEVVLSRVDSLRATLVGDYLTEATAATTYLAQVDLETAFASIDVTVNATLDDLTSDVGLFLDAFTDGAGNVLSLFALEADANGSIAGIYGIADATSSGLVFAADSIEFKTASGTLTPFSVVGDTVSMSNVVVDTLDAGIITADEIATGYSLIEYGSGPPTPTERRMYEDTDADVLWYDNGTQVRRRSREVLQDNLGTDTGFSGSAYKVVVAIEVPGLKELDVLQVSDLTVNFQSPDAATDENVVGEWAIGIVDAARSPGDAWAGSGTENIIQDGRSLTFQLDGSDILVNGNGVSGFIKLHATAGGVDYRIPLAYEGTCYVCLLLKLTSFTSDQVLLGGTGTQMSVLISP
jgi:hypothetical protein